MSSILGGGLHAVVVHDDYVVKRCAWCVGGRRRSVADFLGADGAEEKEREADDHGRWKMAEGNGKMAGRRCTPMAMRPHGR